MLVDLHCHSTCSDGTLAPAEIGRRARELGVELFCLTDHDSCAGWEEARQEFGESMLRGLELSCSNGKQTVHILIYDVARDAARWDVIEQRLVGVASARKHRVHDIAQRFASLGIQLDADEIIASAKESVGRPHVARAVVAAGHARDVNEVFTRWLHDGGRADAPLQGRITVEEGVQLAAEAGGRASLAHPHSVGISAEDLARRLKPLGLGGIEVYCASYSRSERKKWSELASRYKLVETGGSDFHGDAMPEVTRLGVQVPQDVAVRLTDWLG